MDPWDIERDAAVNYRQTIHPDQIRSQAGKRKREKNSRQRSRSLDSYGTERARFIRVTTRPRLSAAALVRQGSFPQKAQRVYGDSLMTSNGDTVAVHISELQQLNLELMRGKLVAHTFNARFNSDGHDLDESSRDLQTYVQALRDFEYMTELRRRYPRHDPYLVSTEWALQREVIQDIYHAGLEEMDSDDAARMQKDLKPLRRRRLGNLSDESNVRRFWKTRTETIQMLEHGEYVKKVGLAVLGGAFLIGPMLVMVLHPGLVTSLVTSVCVFAFGLGVARFLEKPFDVLSGTAAYAAVLVVFVGTSGSSA